MYTISVYYLSMCTVCGHSYVLFVATPTIVSTILMLVSIIIVGVVVLDSTQTCAGFVIVLWVFQYYTPIVSTISGVPRG